MERLYTVELDEISFVRVSYRTDGTINVQGHVGDKQHAIQLLEQAIDAIKRQVKEQPVTIPNCDVTVPDYKFPVLPMGDMPIGDWGDR